MPILKIQPIEYRRTGLSEIGNGIVTAFYPLIDGFVINPEIPLRELDARVFDEHREYFGVTLIGLGLLPYLSKLGKPILGVTSLPASSHWIVFTDLIYGQGTQNLQSAFVSTYLPAFGKPDSKTHVRKLLIESLHEVGHSFGLTHHETGQRTHRGKFCPMTVSHIDDLDDSIRAEARYILSRDFCFCGDCYEQLKINPNIV